MGPIWVIQGAVATWAPGASDAAYSAAGLTASGVGEAARLLAPPHAEWMDSHAPS